MSDRSKKRGAPGRRSDPVACYLFSFLFFALGPLAYYANEQQTQASRLKNPITIDVKLLEATCHGPSGRKRPKMLKTYVYAPQLSDGRKREFKIYDSVSFETRAACEAEWKNAHRLNPRSEAWYDRDLPSNSRWTLAEPSFAPILWGIFAMSGVLFLLGLSIQRRGR